MSGKRRNQRSIITPETCNLEKDDLVEIPAKALKKEFNLKEKKRQATDRFREAQNRLETMQQEPRASSEGQVSWGGAGRDYHHVASYPTRQQLL